MTYALEGNNRCIILATYLVENKTTVRAVARHFGVSKSTVHKDISKKLKDINKTLYNEAQSILDTNKKERHLRGGEATKKKYLCSENKLWNFV